VKDREKVRGGSDQDLDISEEPMHCVPDITLAKIHTCVIIQPSSCLVSLTSFLFMLFHST
jgi:hypothetical protein